MEKIQDGSLGKFLTKGHFLVGNHEPASGEIKRPGWEFRACLYVQRSSIKYYTNSTIPAKKAARKF